MQPYQRTSTEPSQPPICPLLKEEDATCRSVEYRQRRAQECPLFHMKSRLCVLVYRMLEQSKPAVQRDKADPEQCDDAYMRKLRQASRAVALLHSKRAPTKGCLIEQQTPQPKRRAEKTASAPAGRGYSRHGQPRRKKATKNALSL